MVRENRMITSILCSLFTDSLYSLPLLLYTDELNLYIDSTQRELKKVVAAKQVLSFTCSIDCSVP